MSVDDDVQMTFWEHLDELRSRMLKALVALVIGGGVAWTQRRPVLSWLVEPFREGWSHSVPGQEPELHFTGVHMAFFAYLKLSIIAGCLFAMPIILYQGWAFVAPGLYSRERRFAIPFVLCSCLLFIGGGYFGWRIAFPIAFEYLLQQGGAVGEGLTVQPTVTIDSYIDFIARMLLAFGTVFELPVVVFFLCAARIIDHTHLIKFARYFIVVAFLVAAIFTPPDITSQLLLAAPLCALYLVSIGIAWIMTRLRGKQPPQQSIP